MSETCLGNEGEGGEVVSYCLRVCSCSAMGRVDGVGEDVGEGMRLVSLQGEPQRTFWTLNVWVTWMRGLLAARRSEGQ